MLAFTLSRDNAGELLTLARQFNMGGMWYGHRGLPGPASWDLWKYLGDRGESLRPLEPWPGGPQPPASLGSARLEYLKLGPKGSFALAVSGQGRRVLILPPERQESLSRAAASIQAVSSSLDLLVLPAATARAPEFEPWLADLKPRLLVIYGGAGRPGDYQRLAQIPYRLTRDGAVSVFLGPEALRVRQWEY